MSKRTIIQGEVTGTNEIVSGVVQKTPLPWE
jgi:hypothetical protein